MILSLLPPIHLERVLREALSEDAFLSPHGMRALSRRHLADPFRIEVEGYVASIDYEPGESTTGLFGGNSNWRGPGVVPRQLPVHRVDAPLGRGAGRGLHRRVPDRVGHAPAPAGRRGGPVGRLVSIWLPDADGHRPVAGSIAKFRDDPEWRDLLLFHEYFHGDTGAGIGASHQTGWTGLVAHLLCRGGPLDREGL